MSTITIDKDLFCKMIFSLLEEVKISEQVDWLYKYGSTFYDLGLYEAIESKHVIDKTDFTTITEDFWDTDEVLYKEVSWQELSQKIGTDLYQNYLGISFTKDKEVDDIEFNLGAFQSDPDCRYYSPSFLKCIAAKLGLNNHSSFYFTKAKMANNEIGIVFKVDDNATTHYYNISNVPM